MIFQTEDMHVLNGWITSEILSIYVCFSGIWDSHSFPTVKWLVKAVKQKRIDNFTTKWFSDVYTSSSSLNYRIFKTNFAFEKYLVSLPPKFYYDKNKKSSSSDRKWKMAPNRKK